MHSEYLRQLFLGNNLANGRLKVDDKAVALSDIRADIYCVATEAKHVSP
jgi:polyhydroxyalkanoate synthase